MASISVVVVRMPPLQEMTAIPPHPVIGVFTRAASSRSMNTAADGRGLSSPKLALYPLGATWAGVNGDPAAASAPQCHRTTPSVWRESSPSRLTSALSWCHKTKTDRSTP